MDPYENASNDPMQDESGPHLSLDDHLPPEIALSESFKNKLTVSYSTELKDNTRTALVDQSQRKPNRKWNSSQSVSNERTALNPGDDQFVEDVLKNNWNATSEPERTDVALSTKQPLPSGSSRRKSIKVLQNWNSTKEIHQKNDFDHLNLKFSTQEHNNNFADEWIKHIEVRPIVAPQSILKTQSEPNIESNIESPAQSPESRLCTFSNHSVKDLGLWRSKSDVHLVPYNPPIIIDLTQDEPSTKKIRHNGYNQDTTMNEQELQFQNPPIVPIRSPIQCAPVVCHQNPPIVPIQSPIQCAPAFCHTNPPIVAIRPPIQCPPVFFQPDTVRLPEFTAPQSSTKNTTNSYNVYQESTTKNEHPQDSIDPLVDSDKKSLEDHKKDANNFVTEVTTCVDNKRKWKCTFPSCEKTDGFQEAVRARTHVMADHLGIKFACPEEFCTFTCNRLDNLSSHTKIHKSQEYPNGYTLAKDERYKDSLVKVDRYVKKAYLKRPK